MKIGLILFLAKYYHRIPVSDVNKFRFLFFPIICVTAPALLVISQPDLGTAILIGFTTMLLIDEATNALT